MAPPARHAAPEDALDESLPGDRAARTTGRTTGRAAGPAAHSAEPDEPAGRPGTTSPAPPATPPAPEHRDPVPTTMPDDPWGAPAPDPGTAPDPAPDPGAAPDPAPTAQPRPEDLLAPDRPPDLDRPATWGWRGRMSRLSGGLYRPAPTPAEQADRTDRRDAARAFSRPMTIVVVQPKGGGGKTPTTICLAAALGVRRGGYVLGWDNNETRGTLAVRTVNTDRHRTTAWDLLHALDGAGGANGSRGSSGTGGAAPLSRPDARIGDLSAYLRAQGSAQFDALASDDDPGNMEQIGEDEFRRLHDLLQRFYRVIVVDTGNNVRSPNWQAAVDHADQVVVVSTYARDVGWSGSWVLDHLARTGREPLARDAVTVLTAAQPTTDPAVRRELIEHFTARTRGVVEIPYDPHIAEGGAIRWDALSEPTRRAWTRLAADVTRILSERDQAAVRAAAAART